MPGKRKRQVSSLHDSLTDRLKDVLNEAVLMFDKLSIESISYYEQSIALVNEMEESEYFPVFRDYYAQGKKKETREMLGDLYFEYANSIQVFMYDMDHETPQSFDKTISLLETARVFFENSSICYDKRKDKATCAFSRMQVLVRIVELHLAHPAEVGKIHSYMEALRRLEMGIDDVINFHGLLYDSSREAVSLDFFHKLLPRKEALTQISLAASEGLQLIARVDYCVKALVPESARLLSQVVPSHDDDDDDKIGDYDTSRYLAWIPLVAQNRAFFSYPGRLTQVSKKLALWVERLEAAGFVARDVFSGAQPSPFGLFKTRDEQAIAGSVSQSAMPPHSEDSPEATISASPRPVASRAS